MQKNELTNKKWSPSFLTFKKYIFFSFQFVFGVILGFITKLHLFFRPILVPTCALPIMILSLKITFVHTHHILHLLFYNSWQMNKNWLPFASTKEQYIPPQIGSHIVITMDIVLIQFWHFLRKYLLLLLWLIALLTIVFLLWIWSIDWLTMKLYIDLWNFFIFIYFNFSFRIMLILYLSIALLE
jgi:hypothetical protein